MKLKLLVVFVFMPFMLLAEDHNHSRNEIGLSPGVIYSPECNEWGFGLHIHYFRTVGHNDRWAVGGSIEQIISDDTHYGVSVGASFRIVGGLAVSVSPGISLMMNEDSGGYDYHYSTHFELVYDAAHVKNFHFGPALGYALSSHDSHFMLGAHAAYSF
ncbi:MAG: hypothetical protein RRZ64_01905 [Rikenellaceae bacterium]